jgi:hypothetical protein
VSDEPSNAAVIALLKEHMAVSQSLAKEARERSDERERVASEHRGEMRSALKNMDGRIVEQGKTLAEHGALLADYGKQIPAIEGKARDAMKSYDSLQAYVHGEVREHIAEEIGKANGPVLAALKKQDADAERRAAADNASREQQSKAAAKLQKDREHSENVLKIWAPVLIAALGSIATICGAYIAVKGTQANTEAKLSHLQQTVDQKPPSVLLTAPDVSFAPPPATAPARPAAK